MLDEKVIMDRIKSMSPDERSRIMKKALDDAHIPYIESKEGEGIIFNGFSDSEKES